MMNRRNFFASIGRALAALPVAGFGLAETEPDAWAPEIGQVDLELAAGLYEDFDNMDDFFADLDRVGRDPIYVHSGKIARPTDESMYVQVDTGRGTAYIQVFE